MQSTIFDVISAESEESPSSGRTSPESSQPTTTLLDASSARSWEQLPRSFHQEGSAGPTLVWLLAPNESQHGEFSTLNISDSPNDAAACSLSQVLETGSIPQRFFLSKLACAGILRRAEKRGRVLPEHLARALKDVAGAPATTSQGEGTSLRTR